MSSGNPSLPTPAEAAAKYAPTLPKAVRDAAAAADAAQGDVIKSFTSGGAVGGDGASGAPTPQADPGAAPQAQPPAAQPQLPAPGEEQTWEQRARSALGRLEQANHSLTQANERIDRLENLLANMQVQGAGHAPPPPPPSRVELLTPEERDEYGDPMLDVMGRRAREEIDPEIQGLKATIASLENRLNGVGTVIQRQQVKTVYDTLGDAIPNWQAINRCPEFAAWAKELEPYSGQPRMKLIREAFDRHEGDRVVRFFQGFLSEAAALDPANAQPGSRTAPSPNGQAGQGKIPLEAFAAPGRARSAPLELPPEKPTYTRAAITQFWADKRRGLYKGREPEADQIERDIFQAQHEGRITP